MEFMFLQDIIIIFALSVVVIYIFHKIKLPSIIGFLLTGIIAGPHGLKLIHGIEEVEVLAEIGIVLLLFTIGIEFSLKNLMKTKRSIIIGGGLQVGLVILFILLITLWTGAGAGESVLLGFLVALSSTAIVLRIIQNKGELGTFHGRTSVSILIFQDLIIVPMILIIPILSGETTNIWQSLLLMLMKGLGVIIFMIIAARYLVPGVLYQIARTQSKELFLLTIILIGIAAAWFTSIIGLSLALGAFIAGLVISESEYSEQAFGNIIPFRDLFTSFFFVSVGMLLDIGFVMANPVMVVAIAIGIILIKTIVSGFVAFILGFPFRTTVIVGLTLSQVGEFSFILSDIGIEYGLLSETNYQFFLSSAVITISLTPFIIDWAPKLADFILSYKIPKKLRCGLQNMEEPETPVLQNHLIIVGFGINGKNVARAAKFANVPHVILEMNPDTVKEELAKGEIIYYGDATQEDILRHANIENAMILVVTLPHPSDTRLITQLARRLNPHLHIIIRTRYIQDMELLYELGADEVIPEEFETSIEIFSRVLMKFLIPEEEIHKFVSKVRADGYKMFRSLSLQDSQYKNLSIRIPDVEIHSVHVAENSEVTGKKIKDCHFQTYQVTLLALSRAGKVYPKPDQGFVLTKNDLLFFLGSGYNFSRLVGLFKEREKV
jgi:CPA2 family monovalent cation:H+ antiporter-2